MNSIWRSLAKLAAKTKRNMDSETVRLFARMIMMAFLVFTGCRDACKNQKTPMDFGGFMCNSIFEIGFFLGICYGIWF